MGQREPLRELPLIPRGVGALPIGNDGRAPVVVIEHADRLPGGLTGGLMAALLVIAIERFPSALENYFGVPPQAGVPIFVFTTRSAVSPGLEASLCVVELPGYNLTQKAAIAVRAFEQTGRKIPPVLVQYLVRTYCKGVGAEAILPLVQRTHGLTDEQLLPDRVVSALGEPPGTALTRYAALAPGQALGMAAARDGGKIYVVEVCLGSRADGNLAVLGNAGDVLEGAARIALHATNTLLSGAQRLGTTAGRPVLVNLTGSWRAAGVGAGLAMGLAMYGLATDRSLRSTLAAAGELTLGGLVLPVSGCATMLLAAEQEVIRGVMLPDANRRVVCAARASLRADLGTSLVRTFAEAIELAFE